MLDRAWQRLPGWLPLVRVAHHLPQPFARGSSRARRMLELRVMVTGLPICRPFCSMTPPSTPRRSRLAGAGPRQCGSLAGGTTCWRLLRCRSFFIEGVGLGCSAKLVPTERSNKIRDVELARFYERADLVVLLGALGDGDSELPAQCHKVFPDTEKGSGLGDDSWDEEGAVGDANVTECYDVFLKTAVAVWQRSRIGDTDWIRGSQKSAVRMLRAATPLPHRAHRWARTSRPGIGSPRRFHR